ncbi:MAG: RDD family protein [Actinomycetota bacterium]|nr:RDD family protein [Actinomycetota bacterium]
MVALIIDSIALGVVSVVLRALLGFGLGTAVGIVVGLAYYAYFEGSPSGQTPGKKVMNIRVIDFLQGGPIDPGRALIRYLARIVSSIPCGLGYLWMLWDSEKQTWHDKLANTVVVPTSSYPVAAWPG